jgi:hypothetical protein
MLKFKILIQICLVSVICNSVHATLITMDIHTTSSISDFDMSDVGNELKIDYVIENTTQGYFGDSLYRIIIPAGTNQSVYAVQVPDEWTATITSDETEIYTLNGYQAIQCGENKSFSIFAYNEGIELQEIQAMTSLGDWAESELAFVPNGQVLEPATMVLLACGMLMIKRKNQLFR